jgi:hypothetical protein
MAPLLLLQQLGVVTNSLQNHGSTTTTRDLTIRAYKTA